MDKSVLLRSSFNSSFDPKSADWFAVDLDDKSRIGLQ